MPVRDIPGAPCWIDVFTSDPDRTQAFYAEVFGWTCETAGPEYGGYFNFSLDGRKVAGGMHNDGSAGTPDSWSVYLSTDDADRTAAAVTAHGGQVIVPPMPVMALGTMAVVTDAGQAAVGIWQPGEHRGFEVVDEDGAPNWFELLTRDHDASLAFYRDVFRWDVHTVADDPGFRYATLGDGDDALAGIMDASSFLPEGVPAHWSVYVQVADADATVATAVAGGASVVHAPEDTPYGRLAHLTDPTGAGFKLRQLA